jgi:hypothetical protein
MAVALSNFGHQSNGTLIWVTVIGVGIVALLAGYQRLRGRKPE